MVSPNPNAEDNPFMLGSITPKRIISLFGRKGDMDEKRYTGSVASTLQTNFWNYNTGSTEFCKRLFVNEDEKIYKIMTNQRGNLHNYLSLANVLLHTKNLDALLESARYFQPGNFRHPNDSDYVLPPVETIAKFTKDGDLLRDIINIASNISEGKYGKRPLCIMGDFPASHFLNYASFQARLLQDPREVKESIDGVVEYVDVLDSLNDFLFNLSSGEYGAKNKINRGKIARASFQKNVLDSLRSLPPWGSEVNQFFRNLVEENK